MAQLGSAELSYNLLVTNPKYVRNYFHNLSQRQNGIVDYFSAQILTNLNRSRTKLIF